MFAQTVTLLLFVLRANCYGQLCSPDLNPQVDSGFAYLHSEIKALTFLRLGMVASRKMEGGLPSLDKPEAVHKAVEFYKAANETEDDYNCAMRIISAYQGSKNEAIKGSVEALQASISGSLDIQAKGVELMKALQTAKGPEDINLSEIPKAVADLLGAGGMGRGLCCSPGGVQITDLVEDNVLKSPFIEVPLGSPSVSGCSGHFQSLRRIVRGLDPVHLLKARENAAGSENPTR
jgi:hypothetical protein